MKKNQNVEQNEKERISRRKFLTGSAALSAGLFLPGFTDAKKQTDDQDKSDTPSSEERILIKDGTVLTFDPDLGDFEKADILIEGTEIAGIEPNLNGQDKARVIDASNKIVIPGFVDTHRHMWQGAIRNILPDGLLSDYVEQVLGIRRHYRPEDVYIGDLISALGAINAGVTTVLDWSHIGNSPEHTDVAIDGLRESGIRAVYAYGGGANLPENRFPDDIRRLRDGFFSSDNQLLTLAMAAGISESQWELARQVGARISVHVNGTGDLLPVADLLGPDVTCIHCPNLLDEEWQLLAESGARVSISGPIEMQMGHGIPPIQQALDHGIKPSLSVDVETQMPGDMFTQMLSIFTLQRMQVLARERAGEENLPDLLAVRNVIEFATRQGAIDNGLEDRTGTLTPGKKADLVLLDPNRINVIPVNNAYGAIVQGMDSGNVDTVFINGKVRKWKGELVDVDLDRVKQLIHESREYILNQAGRSPSIL